MNNFVPAPDAEGRKTPIECLRDGGSVDAVKSIVESSDWW